MREIDFILASDQRILTDLAEILIQRPIIYLPLLGSGEYHKINSLLGVLVTLSQRTPSTDYNASHVTDTLAGDAHVRIGERRMDRH